MRKQVYIKDGLLFTSYCNIKTQFQKLQQQNIDYKINLDKQMTNSTSGPQHI